MEHVNRKTRFTLACADDMEVLLTPYTILELRMKLAETRMKQINTLSALVIDRVKKNFRHE